jgi:hypothetical protein
LKFIYCRYKSHKTNHVTDITLNSQKFFFLNFVNPLKHESHKNSISKFSSYHTENILHIHYKDQSVKMTDLRFYRVVMKSTIFWDTMPCGPLKVKQHFRWTYRLHLARLIFYPEDIGAICSSETSPDFQHSTWHYIPKDCTLQLKCCLHK